MTDASCVSAVSAHDGPAVDMSADFICSAVHDGWRWVRSAAAPATCGAEKLVPSSTAYVVARELGQRRREDLRARAP